MREIVTAHDQLVKDTILTANKKDMSREIENCTADGSADSDSLNNPELIKAHVDSLKHSGFILPHHSLLDQLLNEIQKVDFKSLAGAHLESTKLEHSVENNSLDSGNLPEEADEINVNVKQKRILAIEQIIDNARKNKWGLCKYNDLIYLYNGAYWSEVDKSDFEIFLGQASEKMGVNWDNARDYKFREQLFKQFMSTQALRKPSVSKNKVLINFLNGTFEVSVNGTKLRAFNRADFLTYQLPFSFDPSATAPIFQKFLDRVLPDIQSQNILAEYLGYIFIKQGSDFMKEEKALILFGTGANGKSVVFEIVRALLGSQNVCNYALQSLTDDKGYHRSQLEGKLVNYASEINGKLEAALFKQLVSGEPVEIRLAYKDPSIMTEYAKLIFNCNELPKDIEHTDAFFRRFLILSFDVTIPPEEQDKNLHKKIINSELPGVFNWVLLGLERLRVQQKFSDCPASNETVERYRNESDTVRSFLNEVGYEASLTEEVSLKELYNDYKFFCSEGTYRQCSKRTFSSRLINIGYVMHRKNYGMAVMAEKKDLY